MFSSEVKDAQGRDLLVVAEPKEIAEFREAINPRDHRVFFGAFDPKKLGFKDRTGRNDAGRPRDVSRRRLSQLERHQRLGKQHRPGKPRTRH